MRYILKLGGSILTEKKSEKKLSPDFSEIIEKLQNHPEGVLVHGAGSFGHPQAEKHGLKTGSRTGVLEVHQAVKDLNGEVMEELEDLGLDAVPIHPSSIAFRDPETQLHLDKIGKISDEGFLPVLHGDVIAQAGKGYTIISGDEIVAELEKKYETGKTGFCSSEKGVLGKDGDVIEEINSLEDFEDRGVKGKDVTGGMKGKIQEVLDKDIEARIFGVKDLENFLNGEEVGTLVRNK